MTLNRAALTLGNSSTEPSVAWENEFKGQINNLTANVLERPRVVTKSANYTLAAGDEGSVIVCTSGVTLSVTAAATLGNGWCCWLRNESGSDVTIDPNGSETVEGLTTMTLGNRETILLLCNGTGFKALGGTTPHFVGNLFSFTATANHMGALLGCVGALTVSLTAAATLGDGWFCYLRNTGNGPVTIDPNGSETVNGQATIALPVGASVMLICNGTAFLTVGYIPGVVVSISSSTTLTAAHADAIISASGTITLTLTLAATLGSAWCCYVKNSGSGVVTIDPSGSDIIDGFSEIRLGPGNGCFVFSGGGVGFGTVGRQPEYILLQDIKSAGTDGGTFTLGAARTRDLNTEAVDTGDNCSLASNQFTLQPGTYRMYASAPGFQVGRHQAFLRNITDSTDVLLGSTEATAGGGSTATRSIVAGQFTISAAKTFQIQHRCNVSRSTDGFGLSTGFNTELYTIAELWKVV